ncbi:MAG: radical SAM protein [Marinilabiliales bacterium]|nr:radical SAM protein [Marinilabiliales bacterium]
MRFTDRAPAAQNLDLLPFPDRRLTREYRSRYRDRMNTKTGLVMTSRGCPYRCSFCACWKIMDGKYLSRSPESIVAEIAAMPEEVDLICFADDNTLHSIRRAWRLIELRAGEADPQEVHDVRPVGHHRRKSGPDGGPEGHRPGVSPGRHRIVQGCRVERA